MRRSGALAKVAVFGATSAIAQATARLLATRGSELFLVGRDPEKLAAVADDVRTRGAAGVTTVAADLNDVSRHSELLAGAAAALGRIDAAIVAQGVLADSDACERDPSLVEAQLVTNLVAPALLCDALGARLVQQGSGTIVGISSVAGDRGRQSNYAYGASKAGFSAFLAGLRNRLFHRGVHVVTVKPGFVDSPMTAHVQKNALFAPSSAVAVAIVRGVERQRDEVYVPGFWRAIMWVIRHVPERIFKRLRM